MRTLALLIAVTIFSMPSSQACSMAPFDVENALQSYNLEASALAALNVDKESVDQVELSEKNGGYIWNNPMCPEGFFVEATFTISFANAADSLSKGCTAVAKVKKSFANEVRWGSKVIPGHNFVKVDVLQSGICLE